MSLHQRERPDRLSFEPKYKKQEEKVFMFVPRTVSHYPVRLNLGLLMCVRPCVFTH